MTIELNVDIETAELQEAEVSLVNAVDAAGGIDALEECLAEVRKALAAVEDEESYEDKLTAALDHATSALDELGPFRELMAEQWRAGRMKASNETLIYVDAKTTDANDELNLWIDYAAHALRELDD